MHDDTEGGMDFANKNIFQYHDGAGIVYGDPLELRRRLLFALGDPDKLVAQAVEPDPATASEMEVRQACAAAEKLCAGIRSALSMKDFNPATGAGATEGQCLATYRAFCAWTNDVKKNAVASPTTPPPSASTPTPSATTSDTSA